MVRTEILTNWRKASTSGSHGSPISVAADQIRMKTS
jgi:hypothetical protein